MLSPLQNLRKEFNAATSEQRLIVGILAGTFLIGGGLAAWQWNDSVHYFDQTLIKARAQASEEARNRENKIDSAELLKSLPSVLSSSAGDYVKNTPAAIDSSATETVDRRDPSLLGTGTVSPDETPSAADLVAADNFLKSLGMSESSVSALSPQDRIIIAREAQSEAVRALGGTAKPVYDISKKPKDPTQWAIGDIRDFLKAYGATASQIEGVDEKELRKSFVEVYNKTYDANKK